MTTAFFNGKIYFMKMKVIFLLLLISISAGVFAQEGHDEFFLYIPNNEEMVSFLGMYRYLRAWDDNDHLVDDERFAALMNNFIDDDTMDSLMFEAYLRYTKNAAIRQRVLNFLDENRIESGFANSLRMLYASVPVIMEEGDSNRDDVIQYNFNNAYFDENIDLFNFSEVYLFNGEMGMLLFDNNWQIISLDSDPDRFFLIFGGGTNSMTVGFRRHTNFNEDDLDSAIRTEHHNNLYGDRWNTVDLPIFGILERAGADRYIIGEGSGPDRFIPEIQTGTFNTYLYNRDRRILYEVSYYMNFSVINIHFEQRTRIYNYLLFHTLFMFLR